MKQRITYLIADPDEFHPEHLTVEGNTFSLKNVKAAKEHRITFSLEELPHEIYRVLKQCHELHIRWASERAYKSIAPFASRVSPGLHAFFTPQKDSSAELLCPLLKKIFDDDLKCDSPKDTFINLPILSERFAHSSSTQYHTLLPSLTNLVTYIQNKICSSLSPACLDQTKALPSASYVDLDYDTISHAVIVNAFWAQAPETETWTETINLENKKSTIEIGVLNNQKNPDPEDVAFSGFLTILGKDKKPKSTQFQTPLRHHTLLPDSTLTYTTYFSPPTGLHPTLRLSLSLPLTPPDKTCKLHTHLTLPSSLFIDKYQFTDPLFLKSKNLVSLRSLAGATDLEAPDWVIPQWGSATLFELATPSPPSADKNEVWNIDIPLHLRYLPPTNSSSNSTTTPGKTPIAIPWPVIFWACHSEEGAKLSVNPFDRVNLGYEGLFGPKTRFFHVPPSEKGNGSDALISWIDVPVLDLGKSGWVEKGTIGVVYVAFWALVFVLFYGMGFSKGTKIAKERKKQ